MSTIAIKIITAMIHLLDLVFFLSAIMIEYENVGVKYVRRPITVEGIQSMMASSNWI